MECLMKPSEMASLSNSRWQNYVERQNKSTNNGDLDNKAKCPMSEWMSEGVSLWHLSNYREAELLKIDINPT